MQPEELRKFGAAGHSDGVTLEQRASGVTRVSIRGEVDAGRFQELEQVLASTQASAQPILEIDLSGVSFMDSQGLRLLLRSRDRAGSDGHRLLIVDPSRFVMRLFEISGLNGMFEVARESANGEICPCCADLLGLPESSGDGLRPGDRWCSECRWVVLTEVLAGGDWPVECPTHGRRITKSVDRPS